MCAFTSGALTKGFSPLALITLDPIHLMLIVLVHGMLAD